jgi:hydrogenase nickel incorporation protein HypA/HybF
MHEYSIVQSLLARVEDETRARNATSVHRVSVRIGALSGVEPELLAKAYSLFREGTACAAAELCIEHVAERWECPGCGRALARSAIPVCEGCGMPARLAAGDEIILERIEMEVP